MAIARGFRRLSLTICVLWSVLMTALLAMSSAPNFAAYLAFVAVPWAIHFLLVFLFRGFRAPRPQNI